MDPTSENWATGCWGPALAPLPFLQPFLHSLGPSAAVSLTLPASRSRKIPTGDGSGSIRTWEVVGPLDQETLAVVWGSSVGHRAEQAF